jgi:hypothetical protein
MLVSPAGNSAIAGGGPGAARKALKTKLAVPSPPFTATVSTPRAAQRAATSGKSAALVIGK